ncbi:MAG TPA: TlpA disulfide reductase family protein [Pyrinomonadaceae bacterium]|jgi:peroxiredoxin
MFKQLPRTLVGFALTLALVCAQALAPGAAAAQEQQPVTFSLRTVDGGAITAEMLRGDVVVLAFGASWLPLSGDQAQGVQRLADEYANRNVRVYWISTDSESPKSKNYATDGQLRDFARRNKLKVAVLRDPDGALFKHMGVERNQLPAVVILDRQGNIAGTPIGGLDPETNLVTQLAPRLNQLL